VLREGDPVAETVQLAKQVGAERVTVSHDVSRYARRRWDRLAAACAVQRLALRGYDTLTVVPPGALRPQGGDHYRVFTPYWRAWRQVSLRPVVESPRTIRLPAGIAVRRLPGSGGRHGPMPRSLPGESGALRRLAEWDPTDYAETRDDLAADRTSRLSAYLHFGCLSPRALLARALPEDFIRQVCWRDFFHQVTFAFPGIVDTPYRRGAQEDWTGTDEDFARWAAGQTGVPLVDAGMRQLAAEGWMHNRARLVTASYLTKDLRVDWRRGAAYFMEALVDGDIANNYGNWQWVAGTGNDPRPYRRFNPERQAERYDPTGAYRRRW
jgi:deoxyribodipyrimidine photo-lyase